MSSGKTLEDFNNGLSYKSLIRLFNDRFLTSFNTRLEGGHDEPIYLPSTETEAARICFRADYASSALHEVAHWCLAGDQRRQQVDYGYWYEPDGRSAEQQKLFELVEVKPQALEWIFSLAAGIRFRISVDNLDGDPGDSLQFAEKVRQQSHEYLVVGLPERGQAFLQSLQGSAYGVVPDPKHFSLKALGF